MRKILIILLFFICSVSFGQSLMRTTGGFLMSGNSFLSTIGGTTPVTVLVETIGVEGVGGVSTITVNGGTLQMIALVLPVNATNRTVNWSVTGTATISNTGLLSAMANGTATVRATANDGSTIYDEMIVTISNQIIPPIPSGNYLIADHNAVAAFDNIPANWLDEVKKMLVWFPGESHSAAYRTGLTLLKSQDATYNATIAWGYPSVSTTALRSAGWPMDQVGESRWFTWKAYTSNPPEDASVIKDLLSGQVTASNPVHVVGFAWCWDMVYGGPTTNADPTLGVHWYGESVGGPDGNKPWGINASHYTQTTNRVSMETYFQATEDYITYCATNSPSTNVVFTTGPVDNYSATGEGGYQTYLKHEAIRDYVKANDKILFDYADILCYNNGATTPNTTTWSDNTYPIITTTNGATEDVGHITNAGAIRLAKAQWWLCARLAGWNGQPNIIKPMSEDHEWFVPFNAEVGDDVGLCAIYPEYMNIGTSPKFSIIGGTGIGRFAIHDSTGNIFVTDTVGKEVGKYTLNIEITKSGYDTTKITATVNYLDVTNITFIDFYAAPMGDGTRESPLNSFPTITSGTVNDTVFYMFKRGSVYSTATEIVITNKAYFVLDAYGQGVRPIISKTTTGKLANFAQLKYARVRNLHFEMPISSGGMTYMAGGGYNESTSSTHHITEHCLLKGGEWAIRVLGTNNNATEFHFCEASYSEDDNVYSQGAHTNYLFNGLYSHHANQDWAPGVGEGTASGDGLQMDGIHDYVIQNCLIDRSDTQNKFSIITNNIIVGGVIENNYLISPMPVTSDRRAGAAIYLEAATNVIVRGNIITGDGNGVQMRGANSEYTLYNNIIECDSGKWDHSGVRELNAYNNVFTNGHMYIWGTSSMGTFYNNIVKDVTYNESMGLTKNYNCYYPAKMGNDAGTHTITADPKFLNQSTKDYRLQKGSPCIDAGVTITGYTKDWEGRTVGTPPNIGISEFNN